MSLIKLSVALLVISTHALPQSTPKFEVASVKIAPPRNGTAGLTAIDTDPATVRYSNITLKNLIAMAYDFDSNRIRGGPQWLDEQMYDVAARVPDGVSKDQIPVMLQGLLTERFQLALHRESKEERAYVLVVVKGGPKWKAKAELEPDDPHVQQVRGDRLPASIMRGRIISAMAFRRRCWPGCYRRPPVIRWWIEPACQESMTST